MSTSSNRRSLKVGAFVLAGLVLSTIAIFTIGESRRVWERKVHYYGSYEDVVGLRPGSVVRMGGIDVGAVEKVEHGTKVDDGKVYVTFSIVKEEAGRIRNATVASIEGKGLLGDKMVVLINDPKVTEEVKKQGKDPFGVVPPEGWLNTVPPPDPLGDAQKAAAGAKVAIENIQHLTETLASDGFKDDLTGTVHSLREVLDGIALRDGVAHRLIFDPAEAQRIDQLLVSLDESARNLAQITSNTRDLTQQVKSGPGLAHALVYDPEFAKGVSGTLTEVNASLVAVRTGNGLAHSVLYGDNQTQKLIGNVNAMSDDLREVVANLRAGRGTLGALLVDPTVYEDVKSLVGNVERNQVLRALVRYSIKQNEDKPHSEVKADEAPLQPTLVPTPQVKASR